MHRVFLPALSISVLLTASALSVSVKAADPVEVPLTIKDHKFVPAEIKAAANQPFVIVVTNEDETPEEFESAVLKLEKIVTPKGTIKLRVRGLAPGRYDFFGEYNESAKGTLIVE